MLHEVIDRVIRFHQHLGKVKGEFFMDEERASDKILFLSSYEDCLIKIFEIAVKTFLSDKEETSKIETLASCVRKVNDLHIKKLGHLPRPSESNELKRFNRIINIQISAFKNEGTKNLLNDIGISIYMQERIGEETFSDPLDDYKLESLNEFIKESGIEAEVFQRKKSTQSIHITIPRIDASNPCRWPTLIHELGHHVMDKKFTFDKDIFDHFVETLDSESKKQFVNDLNTKISLQSWLTECWCDLFATALMGPSFWYSQYSAFIFSGIFVHTDEYPFPAFRLNLIYTILEKRLGNTLTAQTKETILEYSKVVDQLDKNFESYPFRYLFYLFQNYFTRNFFTIEENGVVVLGPDQFNKLIQPLLKYTGDIKEEIIDVLVEDLKIKLPIPSKRKKPDEIVEEFNSVQEIIQAAWIYKSKFLSNELTEMIRSANLAVTTGDEIKQTFNTILNEYNKFDQSILKSIQVSEWFALFEENLDQGKRLKHIEAISVDKTSSISAQLVDFEIYKAIREKSLRIIPLMDPKQIGTTSIDIRLGTSFQYYYPNQFGILDFTDEESINSTQKSTKSVDLDYLKSITLAPGHFLLGHSMEYILLDDKISAELDGRSSFARSGLEIHMTAGFVEPGFKGVLTFEFFNAGSNPIRLFPGMRIGQLRFIPVNEPAEGYSKKREAKYKGMLSQHHGTQFNDEEVQIIKHELLKNKIKQLAKTLDENDLIEIIVKPLKGNNNGNN